MGLLSFFKKGVPGYTNDYDYRIDVILKSVEKLLDGNIGTLRKIRNGSDWMFGGGTLRGLMGTQVLNEFYFDEIDNYFHRGIPLDTCVEEMCNKINKKDFIRKCDEFANRPI